MGEEGASGNVRSRLLARDSHLLYATAAVTAIAIAAALLSLQSIR